MISFFRRFSSPREIYFHEDDYCQQQILPAIDADSIADELRKVGEFSEAHRAPGGMGWTDIYVREEGGPGFGHLKVYRSQFDALIKDIMPAYQRVYSGYSSHRELCKNTGAWGISDLCCIFCDWDDTEIVQNVWVSLFDIKESSVQAAARAIHALAQISPLVFVDWAWDYTCNAGDEREFIRLLSDKLQQIEENAKKIKKS
jgi:hypothetical protein